MKQIKRKVTPRAELLSHIFNVPPGDVLHRGNPCHFPFFIPSAFHPGAGESAIYTHTHTHAATSRSQTQKVCHHHRAPKRNKPVLQQPLPPFPPTSVIIRGFTMLVVLSRVGIDNPRGRRLRTNATITSPAATTAHRFVVAMTVVSR